MPAPLKLTAEQMRDIANSIQLGLSNAAWEGLSDLPWPSLNRDQRKIVLATLKERTAREIAEVGATRRTAEFNARFLARFDLDAVERAEAEEPLARERWLKNSGGKKPSRKGWSLAMNDMLSPVAHFSAEQIRAVDRRLAAKRLPSLRELSGKLNRMRAGILKRGKIRSDAEYYVVKEIVCDTSSDVTEADREKFENLLGVYEARK